MLRIFSDHNGMILEVNYREKNGKIHNYVEIRQHATEQPRGQIYNHNIMITFLFKTELMHYNVVFHHSPNCNDC